MSMDDLVTGGKKKNGKTKTAFIEPPIEKTPVKVYRRLYMFQDSVNLLDDITYTKEQSGNYSYTQGDAIKEGLELLANKLKAEKAPEGYKKK
ncbi:hypothetical protein LCGC14_0433800 [marine sediment metagenome]|uniref:Uncharacterized protein n=2 Tax=root TaxID=1 RepID=A0A831QPP1_9FLAO|nr:hypothetical protein [Pricia sp.]HEA22003.1 hypothetical protein [Pricia antarctica]